MTITVQLCNCSEHGECVWDQVQDGFNGSDVFHVVSCDCEPLYDGRFFVLCSTVKVTRNSLGDEIANVNFLYDDIVHVLQNAIDSCIPPQIDVWNACLPNSVI